jgi:hypothetical protein
MGKLAAILFLTVASVGSCATAQSSAKNEDFSARLGQVRTTFRLNEDGFQGPGAPLLADGIKSAHYVLIGEDHLSREIPRFAAAVCHLMAPGGLDAFAVEIGPEAAKVVNANLRRPDRARRIASFLAGHPDAFAFQNGEDESDMAANCAKVAGPQFRIWGLDQEFFGASGYMLAEMLAANPGPHARAAIEQLAGLDASSTKAAFASGSPGDLFLYKVTDQEMAKAEVAIARDGGASASALFHALGETRAIYLLQQSSGYNSNRRRSLLMKHTLVKYFAGTNKPARVLFKFGDVHIAKGVNSLRQLDVGNFVSERADGEGATSLHVAVYGAKGIHALYNGVGRQVRHEPFVLTDDPDYAWLKDGINLSTEGAQRDWVLLDLRPLRARPPADMPATWRSKVQEYDLVAIAPDLTPSALLGSH